MRVHRGFEALAPDQFRRPVATIGVFDGIHLGHRAVIDTTRDLARELDGESVIVTFDEPMNETSVLASGLNPSGNDSPSSAKASVRASPTSPPDDVALL